MTWSTTKTDLAAFLDSAQIMPYHVERDRASKRFYFHDSEKLREAVYVWKEWTGGNFRKSYKRLLNTEL